MNIDLIVIVKIQEDFEIHRIEIHNNISGKKR